MEISEQTLVDLVKGQATVAQALKDLTTTVGSALPALVEEDKRLERHITKVERKEWYMAGAGTVIGFLLSKYAEPYITLFGGK